MKRKGILTFLFALIVVCCIAPNKAQAASVDDLTFELNSDGESYAVTKCDTSVSGELIIPESYNGKPVTIIGNEAFGHCRDLTSITIPNGIKSIGDKAFSFCTSWASVTIPDSVITIGKEAFAACRSLTKVIIPDNVTTIGDNAFFGCNNLISITISSSVTSIGDNAFDDCRNLTGIWVAEDNPNYSSDSFGVLFNKSKTTFIAVPYAIKSYTIPNTVTTIGENAFDCCEALTSISIPDSVTTIGTCAFSACWNLTSISIPASVTSIGESAFSDCGSLTGIWVAEGNPNYSSDTAGVLFNKNKTELICAPSVFSGEYMIPDSVTTISPYAFDWCNLTGITIPNSVTTIGGAAFVGCDLTSVTIPNSVTTIDDAVFFSCYKLTEVTIPNSVTSIGRAAFNLGVKSPLTDVYYTGTQAQWNAIQIDDQNESLSNATLHFIDPCAKGHSWDEGAITKSATETQEGVKTYTCGDCSETKTEPIPTLAAPTTKPTVKPSAAPATTPKETTKVTQETKPTATKPAATQATKPVATKPAATQAKPVATQATKPIATQAKPVSTQATKPAATQSKPIATAAPNEEEMIESATTTSFGVTVAPDAASTVAATKEPVTVATTEPAVESDKDGGLSTGVIIAIIVVAVLGIGGVGVYFVLKKKMK